MWRHSRGEKKKESRLAVGCGDARNVRPRIDRNSQKLELLPRNPPVSKGLGCLRHIDGGHKHIITHHGQDAIGKKVGGKLGSPL